MAYLIYEKGGSSTVQFPIDRPVVSVGRHKDNHICIDDSLVSKNHLQIEIQNSERGDEVEYYIEDLNSTNNTFVNNRKITRKRLRHNDEIRIGVTILRFIEYEEDEFESTAVIKKTWIPGIYVTKDKNKK
jgi:pSer/pThr/pTyr-binding forkhead associated (FHA) protein